MVKKLLLFIMALGLPVVSVAGATNDMKNNTVVHSYNMMEQDVLAKMPLPEDLSGEVKRLYSAAQTARKKGDIEEAIHLYRNVLDERPDFARARFELALCYIDDERWDRADYYLRMAMAAENLPDDVKQVMEYYRYLVRQNKNWDFWSDYGGAPDTRASITDSNNGCMGDVHNGICEQLTDSKSDSGVYFGAGADYEFKLSDDWRWKSDAEIHTNIYDGNRYSDLYLAGSTGPRYIWDKGDIWLAGVVGRGWYESERYVWSYGAKIDTNYDRTRKLSSGLVLLFANNVYDEYNYLMAGQTYTAVPHFTYYIDSTKYISLLGELGRETAKVDSFANYNYGAGLGFGMEIPYGFIVYLESYFFGMNYDGEIDVVKNGVAKRIKERDLSQKYTLSLSNAQIEFFGFMPVLKLNYINKKSNIPISEHNKWSVGVSIKRKF
jgi:tetratricopeptide (TPR) repeat protein